jgi:NitT/TauT family transport system permease protein
MTTWIKDALAYLWGGWAAAAGLLLLAALWQAGHDAYGSFILPSPQETVMALVRLFANGDAAAAVTATGLRALSGFVLSAAIGAAIGLAVGRSPAALRAVRPVVTVLLGIPPIAWIVLALLWFGSGGKAPVFTVVVTSFPIAFAGAVEGARTLDQGLEDMARSFGTPFLMRMADIHLPHVLSYLFPAWITALGTAWKVTVMAELLGAADGIGAGMAVSRVNLDTAEAMAWTLAVVGALLAVEYLVLHPLQRQMEPWRTVSAPPRQGP